MNHSFLCTTITCSLFLLVSSMTAQSIHPPLKADEKRRVIDSVGAILERNYVFPDVGKQIKQHLVDRWKEGAYDLLTDPMEFDRVLTADIRAVNNDRHLDVGFNPDWISRRQNALTKEDSLAIEKRIRREGELRNYGFREIKLLEGNIGYLNLTEFFHVNEASGSVAESAMNFLANADALIIDLRQNGGGSPSMIQLITSYLMNDEPVHLNSFYHRPEDHITQTWTLPYVPGKRRPAVDVYVLTSRNTFSAAEEFSYNLRNLNRATLVGEVTGGGAHPGGTHIATDRYTVWVPTGRAINPVTGTNWEQVGVQPHVEVPADLAMWKAQELALTKLIEHETDQEMKGAYEWNLETLQSLQNPVTPESNLLKSYAGTYGPRKISFEDGQLFYQREGNAKYLLIPMTQNRFRIEEIPYFRLKIELIDNRPAAVIGMYSDGRIDRNERNN